MCTCAPVVSQACNGGPANRGINPPQRKNGWLPLGLPRARSSRRAHPPCSWRRDVQQWSTCRLKRATASRHASSPIATCSTSGFVGLISTTTLSGATSNCRCCQPALPSHPRAHFDRFFNEGGESVSAESPHWHWARCHDNPFTITAGRLAIDGSKPLQVLQLVDAQEHSLKRPRHG